MTRYKVGDVRRHIIIRGGKIVSVSYDECIAVYNNTNTQLCGYAWKAYHTDDVPDRVFNAVTVNCYTFT